MTSITHTVAELANAISGCQCMCSHKHAAVLQAVLPGLSMGIGRLASFKPHSQLHSLRPKAHGICEAQGDRPPTMRSRSRQTVCRADSLLLCCSYPDRGDPAATGQCCFYDQLRYQSDLSNLSEERARQCCRIETQPVCINLAMSYTRSMQPMQAALETCDASSP